MQQLRQSMPTILARIGQRFGTRAGQVQRVMQLAVSQQPGNGGDRGTTKSQQQTMVEIEPRSPQAIKF